MLIDSNILIYSINTASPKNKVSQDFLQKNISYLVLAHQNIFESLRVLTHPKFSNPMGTKEAVKAIEAISDVCKVISPDYKTHQIAFELIEKYSFTSDKIFDAYLIATALSNNIQDIATDNIKDFAGISEITLINPYK